MRKLDIKIPDKYLIDAVIGGITDENVARTVRSTQHRDANELYAYMTTSGNLPPKNEKSKIAFGTKNDQKDRSLKSTSSNQFHAVNSENPKPTSDKTVAGTSQTKFRIECFNCGKTGHIAKKCRMPRVECNQCKRLGHPTEKCLLKKM